MTMTGWSSAAHAPGFIRGVSRVRQVSGRCRHVRRRSRSPRDVYRRLSSRGIGVGVSIRQRLIPTPEQVVGMESLAHYRRFVRNLAVGYGHNWHGHRAGHLVPDTEKKPAHVRCRRTTMDVVTSRPFGPSMFTDPDGFLTHESAHPRVVFTAPMVATYAGFCAMFTELRDWARTEPDLAWINTGARVVGDAALKNVTTGLDNWWAGRAAAPTFRRRTTRDGSFRVRDLTVTRLNKNWGLVTLPKLGRVRFRITRQWTDITAASSATVSLSHGRWHVCFTTPSPAKKAPGTGHAVGIDRGCENTIATSDGTLATLPGLTVGEECRFLVLEQRLARQTRDAKTAGRRLGECRNRERTLDQLGVLRRRLHNRRTDWLEKTTTTLAGTYDLIALETLNTAGMTRRPAPKPDPDNPGTWLLNRARAKAALNRLILGSRWAEFATRLTDKTDAVVFVPAAYSSQECSACGHTAPENRESQAIFECVVCGRQAHADINAAHVILERGHSNSGAGPCAQPEDIGGSTLQAQRRRVGRSNPTERNVAA